ncbi:MAG: MAPEG family protein [Gammaproteobacteria bacterium]|nr:MAPEG family protein [Gammaproteobacteria bacterium]
MLTVNQAALYPLLAMVTLTLVVWIWMYITRVTAVIKGELKMDAFQSAQKSHFPNRVIFASDNLSNLFEMPVLFYSLTILLYITDMFSETQLLLAWYYVGFRSLHSLIHCSYNKVVHRLLSYLVSSLILWLMWGIFAYELLINSMMMV